MATTARVVIDVGISEISNSRRRVALELICEAWAADRIPELAKLLEESGFEADVHAQAREDHER
jgi:hypothetical protein